MRNGLRRIGAMGLLALMVALILTGCGEAPNQWQNIGPTSSAQINTLASDPHIPGILFAGGSDGTTYVARGDRSGVFVPSEKSPGRDPVNVIFANPYVNGAVYAGTAGGFFVSSDYGVHYAPQNGGLPDDANVNAITTGADAKTLFVSLLQKGLYTSADGGKSWKAIMPAVASTKKLALPVNATVEALLWDGASRSLYGALSGPGGGLYISGDGGVRWSAESAGLPANTSVYALLQVPRAVAPIGATLFAATSSGVFASSGAGNKWQSASEGLPAGTVYSLASYPSKPGLLYAGTDKTAYATTDGGAHWTKVADGLTHAVPAIVISPGQHTPTVAYVAAGQIARYPAASVGGGGILSVSLLLIIVVLTGWYVLGRYGIVPTMTAVRRRITRRGVRT